MHQSIDKKQKYIFLIIIFLFLTTINNTNFVNNKYFSANIQSIQVVGLTEDLNSQIQERIYEAFWEMNDQTHDVHSII